MKMTEEHCNIVFKTFQHLNKFISFVGVLLHGYWNQSRLVDFLTAASLSYDLIFVNFIVLIGSFYCIFNDYCRRFVITVSITFACSKIY